MTANLVRVINLQWTSQNSCLNEISMKQLTYKNTHPYNSVYAVYVKHKTSCSGAMAYKKLLHKIQITMLID